MVNTTGHQGRTFSAPSASATALSCWSVSAAMLKQANGSRSNPSVTCLGAVMTVELSDEEMLRYNRQIVLRGFDLTAGAVKSRSRAGGRPRRSAAPPRSIWPPPGRAAHPARFRHCLAPTCSARRCTATPPSASRRWIPPRRWRINPTSVWSRSMPCWMRPRWRRRLPITIWC